VRLRPLGVLVLPLRVGGSSAYRRVRRDSAPAGGSLSFVASNESNQSKDAFHFAVPLRLLPSATCRLRTDPDHGTPVQRTPPLVSLRIVSMTLRAAARPGAEAKRGVDRECLRSKRPHCSSGPVGGVEERRGLGPRAKHASSTDFARLSERSGQRPRSEFGARPQRPSTAEQSGPSRTAPVGVAFLCLLSLAKQRKKVARRGDIPAAASRSEQNHHANSATGLRYSA
jgi:hypothetical protein